MAVRSTFCCCWCLRLLYTKNGLKKFKFKSHARLCYRRGARETDDDEWSRLAYERAKNKNINEVMANTCKSFGGTWSCIQYAKLLYLANSELVVGSHSMVRREPKQVIVQQKMVSLRARCTMIASQQCSEQGSQGRRCVKIHYTFG